MIKRLLFTLGMMATLSSCYAWEMVLEDPLDRVSRRVAELCPLAFRTAGPRAPDFELDKLNAALARQFPRELALSTVPVQGESCRSENIETRPQSADTPPLLIQGWVTAQEYTQQNPSSPLGWPAAPLQDPLEIKMELHLTIWQKTPVQRLKEVTVSETARAAQTDRALLLAQLQERLLQKAFQGLTPRYSYR